MTLNKRKMKRKLVHRLREMNKVLYDDDLWQGRFCFKFKYLEIHPYKDGSGLCAGIWVELIDKKTGLRKTKLYNSIEWLFTNKPILRMNDFIVEESGVWKESPNPRDPEYKKLNNFRGVNIE